MVDVAIGVSKFIIERHQTFGLFPAAAFQVIYNTPSRRVPLPTPRPENAMRVRFGFLGQVIPTKGVRELIEAFSLCHASNAELRIAGKCDSDYASTLRTQTQGVTNIEWLGYVDSEQFLQSIDVLVVPSIWHDTAPLVILEAFCQGIPVLGSLRGGIPELIPPNCGWLFEPNDPSSLINAIGHCIRSANELESMRKSCIALARTKYNLPWAGSYIDAFREAIAMRRNSAVAP